MGINIGNIEAQRKKQSVLWVYDFFGGEEKAVRYMCFKPPPECSPEDTPCCQIF